MPQTHTVVLELLLVLAVQQGLSPWPDRPATAHVPFAKPGSTGQVQGQDAVTVPKTIIAIEQELVLVLLVQKGKFLLLGRIHLILVTMVIQNISIFSLKS